MSNREYVQNVQSWRDQLEASLRAADGWLALAGLFWLHEGANTCGAHPSCDVQFPAGSAPAHVGVFELHAGQVTFHAQANQLVTWQGKLVTTMLMRSDMHSAPTRFSLNALDWLLIQRGERFAIRVWDRNNPARKTFAGRKWFAIDEAFRITAQFVPSATPRPMTIATIVDGITEAATHVGDVIFEVRAQAGQLAAVARSNGGLRLIFRDLTSGVTTHPNCRYLDTEPPRDQQVVLDFNLTCNLPCAFTPFTICPLPPAQNHLKLAIEAGERYTANL